MWGSPALGANALLITKSAMASQATELPGQVEALLRAVNATNDFEADMAVRFGGGTGAASEEVRIP